MLSHFKLECTSGAFSACDKIESITIPPNVVTMETNAFRGCTTLHSVNILEGIREIQPYTFQNCTSLKEVIIPKSITKIGRAAFIRCRLDHIFTDHTHIDTIKGLLPVALRRKIKPLQPRVKSAAKNDTDIATTHASQAPAPASASASAAASAGLFVDNPTAKRSAYDEKGTHTTSSDSASAGITNDDSDYESLQPRSKQPRT